ncbi:MAG: hypothetical protein RI985_1081, partial [Chloroflexota bacterium]
MVSGETLTGLMVAAFHYYQIHHSAYQASIVFNVRYGVFNVRYGVFNVRYGVFNVRYG